MIVKLVSPHASLTGQTAIVLAIFAVAALPGFILAAFTIDKIGRKLLQSVGFAMMAVAFACLWLVPGATTTLPAVGLSKTCSLVAGVSVLGLLVTLLLLPEPKGSSLEDFTENGSPTSAVALGISQSRGTRVPSA